MRSASKIPRILSGLSFHLRSLDLPWAQLSGCSSSTDGHGERDILHMQHMQSDGGMWTDRRTLASGPRMLWEFSSLYITFAIVSGAQLKTRVTEDNSCREWV
ncbi:hypothetical protein EYF80_003935 [Liparis tanakae]|uniref:Uncharacterized protein n=1 Tax=Liparis tanakae TaxID=230148 RepID=A0A4Z2J7M5_9TELE|nr:hypothetical protein EYF80_003935 [Liparis tanakae]